MESEAYDMEGNNMWFKQGKFPINLQAESQGELMDGTHIKVTTLIDTGCSKPIMNKKFYDKHPYLHEMPHYALLLSNYPIIPMKVGKFMKVK